MPSQAVSGRELFPKAYADRVQKLRVPSGFLLLAAFAWLSRPTYDSLLLGVPISLAGLWLRAWAAGHLAKNEKLAMSGPYAYIRNPLYAGTLLTAAGVAVSASSLVLAGLLACVFVMVYLPVIQLEEQHLRNLFPSYEAYARQVRLLLPGGKVQGGGEKFRWSLYLRNEEYKALGGYLVGFAWLLWRATH